MLKYKDRCYIFIEITDISNTQEMVRAFWVDDGFDSEGIQTLDIILTPVIRYFIGLRTDWWRRPIAMHSIIFPHLFIFFFYYAQQFFFTVNVLYLRNGLMQIHQTDRKFFTHPPAQNGGKIVWKFGEGGRGRPHRKIKWALKSLKVIKIFGIFLLWSVVFTLRLNIFFKYC